jgi:hypothetical protein
MFESGFTRELIDLGFSDAHARRDELVGFLGGEALAQTIMLPQLRAGAERD